MEWNQMRLPAAGIAVIALAGLTYYMMDKNTGDSNGEGAGTPELASIERDAVTRIEVDRPGEEPATVLVRDGDDWVVSAPVQAPAADVAVDTMLDKLTELNVVGRAARTSSHHAEMEVDAETGIHVVVQTGDTTALDFWLGDRRSGSTLVRVEGEDDVLMVEGSIDFAFDKPVRDFRDRTITALNSSEIRQATFINENGLFRFNKGEEGWEQVPEPLEEGGAAPVTVEDFASNRVVTAVSSLARLSAADFGGPDLTTAAAGFDENSPRVILVQGEGDEATTTTLTVGGEVESGQRYIMVEGNSTIFRVGGHLANRLLPNIEDFQPEPESETPTPPPGGMPGMPGMPGGGGPGGGQIPPEILQQLQQQMQNAGH